MFYTVSSLVSPCGLDWVYICQAATKVVPFIDLAGHTSRPANCCMVIGSSAGVIGMTKGVWNGVFGWSHSHDTVVVVELAT